ncbi:MAG: DUF3080 family protein [Halioglobus sp.]
MKYRQGSSNAILARICYCAVTSLAMLTACSELGPERNLDNYIERLERTLQLEAPERIPGTSHRPPKVSELRQTITSGNLGALDFLSLSGCAVQITIGKRNSSLGIMASDSQRLLLALEYLEHAPECIRHMRSLNRNEIATVLEDAFRLKQRQLPKLIYNATIANTEFRQFWKAPEKLRSYPAQTSSAVLSALSALNQQVKRWLEGEYTANNLEFEILLSEIAKGDGGALIKAFGIQQSYLDSANALLKMKLSAGPLCTDHKRDAAATILPNVVHKFFIGEVQPWSADLGRRYHELLPPISKLEELLSAGLSEKYEQWRHERNEVLSLLVTAPSNHAGVLKETLDSCGGFGTFTRA